MKTADAIAEILKREGVEWVIGYPVNHILERGAARRHPPDHRAPGAHRPAHGRRDLARHQRQEARRVRHAARARHRERLRRRGAGLQRVGADPGDADGLCAPARLGASRNYNASVRCAASPSRPSRSRRPRRSPTIFRRAFTRLRSGRGGPVLVEVPIDVWNEEIDAVDLRARRARCAAAPIRTRSARPATLLLEAKRPVIYAGQGVHWAQAWAELARAGRAAGHSGLHQPAGQERVPRDASAVARLRRPRHPGAGASLPAARPT